MKKGAVDFISKPVDPEKLIDAVSSALAKQQFRRAGLKTPADIVARYASLTSREREVCQELARGKTNRETARTLHISERTVEGHRASSFKKLGVHTVRGLLDFLNELLQVENEKNPPG